MEQSSKKAPKKSKTSSKKKSSKIATTKKTVKNISVSATPSPAPTEKTSPSKAYNVSPDQAMDSGIMTTILALFVLALVILGGYIYSQKMNTEDVDSSGVVYDLHSAPEVNIEPTISLTPHMQNALIVLAKNFLIEPDEVLQNVRVISDLDAIRSESPSFYADADNDDLVFVFQTRSFIFRPSTNQIVNAGVPVPSTLDGI